MDAEKKNAQNLLLLLITIITFYFIFEYLFINNDTFNIFSINSINTIIPYFLPVYKYSFALKIFYVLLLILFSIQLPGKRQFTTKEGHRGFFVLGSCVFSFAFIVGYMNNYIYNVFIYPIIFLLNIYFISKTVYLFIKNLREEKFFKKINQKKSDFQFIIPTRKGNMHIHKPQMGIWIDGATGSGKSESLISHIILQCIKNGYSLFGYDFEGDPRKKGHPILANFAYSCMRKYPNTGLEFRFVNFTDLGRSHRFNILTSDIIESQGDCEVIAQILLKSLNREWKNKTNFWSENASLYVSSVIWMLYKNYRNMGYNTLPHAIAICMCNLDNVVEWLNTDEEISFVLEPITAAVRAHHDGQKTGVISSSQLPLRKLVYEPIFWVLSGNDFSFDISNKENPAVLFIGNTPNKKEYLSPVISTLSAFILNLMTLPGKNKSVFCVDEFPTINLLDIDVFINTVRKHETSVVLSLQNFAQAQKDYGDKPSEVIMGACGNQFFGKANTLQSAKMVCDILGDTEKIQTSYNTNMDSMSINQSMRREKILQPRDIYKQPPGHFTYFIADGDPVEHRGQFKMVNGVEKHEIPMFSLPVDTGDIEKDYEILDSNVKDNFKRIIKEVKDILNPYGGSGVIEKAKIDEFL